MTEREFFSIFDRGNFFDFWRSKFLIEQEIFMRKKNFFILINFLDPEIKKKRNFWVLIEKFFWFGEKLNAQKIQISRNLNKQKKSWWARNFLIFTMAEKFLSRKKFFDFFISEKFSTSKKIFKTHDFFDFWWAKFYIQKFLIEQIFLIFTIKNF